MAGFDISLSSKRGTYRLQSVGPGVNNVTTGAVFTPSEVSLTYAGAVAEVTFNGTAVAFQCLWLPSPYGANAPM